MRPGGAAAPDLPQFAAKRINERHDKCSFRRGLWAVLPIQRIPLVQVRTPNASLRAIAYSSCNCCPNPVRDSVGAPRVRLL